MGQLMGLGGHSDINLSLFSESLCSCDLTHIQDICTFMSALTPGGAELWMLKGGCDP